MANTGLQANATQRPAHRDDAALLTALAGMLGLQEDNARRFAGSGRLQLDDIEFALHTNDRSSHPPQWIAEATLPCPPQVDRSTWHDALLVANEAAMISGEWGFTVDDEGSASLLMRVGESMRTPACLRAVLEGMYELCSAVRAGASALPASQGVSQ
ncbi:hypothetical protein [Trinickia sp.]|uniref:hypothetical protein n=1 Tax=Trinickia sp. TaxID=2571163 RepID=UPI003F7DE359